MDGTGRTPVQGDKAPDVDTMGVMEREELAEQRALAHFLAQMEDYTPAIPDAVTSYYLKRAGFDCPDEKVVRMVSLAAQKFIADIANEALQQQKKNQAVMQQQTKKPLPKDKKIRSDHGGPDVCAEPARHQHQETCLLQLKLRHSLPLPWQIPTCKPTGRGRCLLYGCSWEP
eukprot:comp22905_c0_seq1/m.36231 comp22905_c0_seq1/g.36231  ORF comp22905_c0_seq1/g.36231 comp22905_c0_seq1/m.36231 type:complete len:172 (-) comp22905_c0_seq1:267-782(-)